MKDVPGLDAVPAPLRTALLARGYTSLTPVQEAVLDPELEGHDLRLSSRTGSGKTVAIGLVIAAHVARDDAAPKGGPFALVVVPTRELAAQVHGELSWLLAGLRTRVLSVTGGTSVVAEKRALFAGAEIVVGTPGRLTDHLTRGALDASRVRALVLDEADQMLDLGFRDELELIASKVPAQRQTHMVSATFSREVLSLADRYQRDAVSVAGSRLGEANVDITFRAHMIVGRERDQALVNLLLMAPGERTLVFTRTRQTAMDLGDDLAAMGFAAAAMTGEMEQRDRTRTLEAFRSGALRILVATDVAARGIDVADIMRVIHADPPESVEALTHRSGRTGRAGKKGESVVLVPTQARGRVAQLFRAARIQPVFGPVPASAEVLASADERLRRELTEETDAPPRLLALAASLLGEHDPVALVARLLARAGSEGPCAPRPVTQVERDGPMRPGPRPPFPAPYGAPRPASHAAARPAHASAGHAAPGYAGPAGSDPPRAPHSASRGFVPFRINWGQRDGADPRRLLALVCRRGSVRGQDVGAIQIGPTQSLFEVSTAVAQAFAQQAREPDTRDPRVRIEPLPEGGAAPEPARPPSFGDRPPRKPGPRPFSPQHRPDRG